MRSLFAVVLSLCSVVVFAQNRVVVKQITMTGAEYNRTRPKITDPKVYDWAGKVLDSVKVKQMVKTFDYGVGMAIPEGQTEMKHVLMKLDHAREAEIDVRTKLQFRPKSPLLWDGVTIDLSPLANRTDLTKLEGKAVVLIFWNNAYGGMLDPVNEVIADYIGTGKFDVFAITHLPYDVAREALKKHPILNAHLVLDAQSITDFYDTGNDAVIVVTNAKHQITFAITGMAGMTPRTLNKLFKEL